MERTALLKLKVCLPHVTILRRGSHVCKRAGWPDNNAVRSIAASLIRDAQARRKSRGFCLEATHVVAPERLSKLLGLLSLAFCWAFAVGVWLAQGSPLKIKKHGRYAVSLFRHGLDWLRRLVMPLCGRSKQAEFKIGLWSGVRCSRQALACFRLRFQAQASKAGSRQAFSATTHSAP